MKIKSTDFLGNIAIVGFYDDAKQKEKKRFAIKLIKENRQIKTVVEKLGKVKGRLRKISTKYLAGEKTKEALYMENNCAFRFNVDSTYFSPRLSNERKEIAESVKEGSSVLVMFAGVGPFSIVIAKNSKAKKVFSNEINKEANKYARLNVELNKLKEKIEIISGDIKRIAKKINQKFDIIVMPRPQLKDTFLEQAFLLSKKGTKVFYYDFCKVDESELILEKIKKESEKFKKEIKILKTKRAGEIAPYKIRIRVDFEILN